MANFLSKIGTAVRGAFNTLNAEPAPLPGTPLPAGAAEINQSARGQVIAANGASTDAWTKKFASKPYFDGGIIRPTLGFSCANPPKRSNKIAREIYDRSQPLFTDDDLKKLAVLRAEERLTNEKLEEASFYSVTARYKEQREAAGEKFLRGEPPTATGLQEMRNVIGATREALHLHKKRIAESVYAIVAPACELMKATARELAGLWDDNSRAEHALYNDEPATYVPSEIVRAFAFFALDIAEAPIRNFKLCSHMSCPDPDNLFAFWHTEQAIQKILPKEKIAEDSIGILQRQAQENEKIERKKQVAEHNLFIEKLKQQGAVAIEDAKNREAMAEAAKEKRKQDALAKLNAEPDKPAEPEKQP